MYLTIINKLLVLLAQNNWILVEQYFVFMISANVTYRRRIWWWWFIQNNLLGDDRGLFLANPAISVIINEGLEGTRCTDHISPRTLDRHNDVLESGVCADVVSWTVLMNYIITQKIITKYEWLCPVIRSRDLRNST